MCSKRFADIIDFIWTTHEAGWGGGKWVLFMNTYRSTSKGCSESHSGAMTKQEALSVSRCEEKDLVVMASAENSNL